MFFTAAVPTGQYFLQTPHTNLPLPAQDIVQLVSAAWCCSSSQGWRSVAISLQNLPQLRSGSPATTQHLLLTKGSLFIEGNGLYNYNLTALRYLDCSECWLQEGDIGTISSEGVGPTAATEWLCYLEWPGQGSPEVGGCDDNVHCRTTHCSLINMLCPQLSHSAFC